jgi:hypothetical protein
MFIPYWVLFVVWAWLMIFAVKKDRAIERLAKSIEQAKDGRFSNRSIASSIRNLKDW